MVETNPTAKKGGTCKDSDNQVSQSKRYEYLGRNYVYLFRGRAFLFIEALNNNDFPRFLGNGLELAYVTKFGLVHYRI